MTANEETLLYRLSSCTEDFRQQIKLCEEYKVRNLVDFLENLKEPFDRCGDTLDCTRSFLRELKQCLQRLTMTAEELSENIVRKATHNVSKHKSGRNIYPSL